MKICWDNIENLCLTRNKCFKYKNTYLIELDSCKRCGEPYLTNKSRQSEYCGISCLKKDMVVSNETKKKISKSMSGKKHPWYGRKHSEASKKKMSDSSIGIKHSEASKKKMSESRVAEQNPFFGKHHTEATKQKISSSHKGVCVGDKNPSFKGGARSKGLALYDTYAEQLKWCEEVRSIEKDGIKTLQVRCTNNECKKLFIPTFNQVINRLLVLKGQVGGNNRFYCCSECKDSCLIYNRSVNEQEKLYSNYELQIWSKTVLERENYICEFCGGKAVHAHHIKPKKLFPKEALDSDNGVACCSKCHYKYGHRGECSTANLKMSSCFDGSV